MQLDTLEIVGAFDDWDGRTVFTGCPTADISALSVRGWVWPFPSRATSFHLEVAVSSVTETTSNPSDMSVMPFCRATLLKYVATSSRLAKYRDHSLSGANAYE